MLLLRTPFLTITPLLRGVIVGVSKKWLRRVFRVNTERFYIGAVSAPCKETLAAQGIPNLTHMSLG